MQSETQRHVFESGALFAERYRVESLLGCGGMGEVYLAEDTFLEGEKVALKILLAEHAADERQMKRFLREVQLTRKVTHPNIARTFEVGVSEGRLFFTMEYVEGKPLTDLLEHGVLPAYETCQIVKQICEGLTAIHEENIVHRDLKPANIILTPTGVVKITDFGVARPGVSNLTRAEEVVGSAPYMAPEIWVGKEIGPTTDLYALGVLTYELLTGIWPHSGETSAEMMFQHIEGEIVLPSVLQPETPPWVDRMIARLLAKEMDQRVQSARQLADMIEANLQGCSGDVRSGGGSDSPLPVQSGAISLEDPFSVQADSQERATVHASTPVSALFDSPTVRLSRPVSLPVKPAVAFAVTSFLRFILAAIICSGIVLACAEHADALLEGYFKGSQDKLSKPMGALSGLTILLYGSLLFALPALFFSLGLSQLRNLYKTWCFAAGAFFATLASMVVTRMILLWSIGDGQTVLVAPVMLDSVADELNAFARPMLLMPLENMADLRVAAKMALPGLPVMLSVTLYSIVSLFLVGAVVGIAARQMYQIDRVREPGWRRPVWFGLSAILLIQSLINGLIMDGTVERLQQFYIGPVGVQWTSFSAACGVINWSALLAFLLFRHLRLTLVRHRTQNADLP